MIYWRLLLGFLCLWLVFFHPALVGAQLRLNEIYPNPLTLETEWIELYNDSSQSANLAGFKLEDQLSSPHVIFTFGEVFLSGGQWMVATVSGQLNNSGDGVVLKNPVGEVVDVMTYASSAASLSWNYRGSGDYYLGQPSAGLVNLPPPTPLPAPTPSSTPSPAPAPSPSPNAAATTFNSGVGLDLLEVATCPISGLEWLKWHNSTAQTKVLTVGVRDLQNNSLNLNLELGPGSEQVTTLSRHIFNNSGDEIFLYLGENLWRHYALPECEVLGTVFDLETGVALAVSTEVAIGMPAEEVTAAALSASLSSTGVSLTPKPFIYPRFPLDRLRLTASAGASLTLGATTSGFTTGFDSRANSGATTGVGARLAEFRPPESRNSGRFSFLPPLLLIGGGFSLFFLGIIEFYERHLGQTSAVG